MWWRLQANESLSNLTGETAFLLADLAKATGGNVKTIPNPNGSYDLNIQGTLATDSHHVGARIVKLVRGAGGHKLRLQQINHRRKEGGYRRH